MVKKKLIIEKSLELFAEQGFKATSVQQITDHCGISKGAFYLSFESKDELIMNIIDHFMMQVISDIDYAVRSCKSKHEMLYDFLYTTLLSFSKHFGFATLFVKEQALPPKEELLLKMKEYDDRVDQIILYTLREYYGERVNDITYDLLICIKGFIRNYAELAFQYSLEINLDSFVKSLVEKINILADHVTLPLMTHEGFQKLKTSSILGSEQIKTGVREMDRDQIITLIEHELLDTQDQVEVESLEILKENLLNPEPRLAVVRGLLENIKSNPHCKWIAYLIRQYYHL